MKSLHLSRYLLLIVVALTSACTFIKVKKEEDKAINIINSTFLQVVDTMAYKYHSLRPSINGPIFNSKEILTIGVYDKFTNVHNWKTEILSHLSTLRDSSDYLDYLELYDSNSKDTLEKPINITQIKETGRFKLIALVSKDADNLKGSVGEVYFSRIIYSAKNDKALFVVTIKDNVKSGIVKLIFLEKVNNKWNSVKEETLEIW